MRFIDAASLVRVAIACHDQNLRRAVHPYYSIPKMVDIGFSVVALSPFRYPAKKPYLKSEKRAPQKRSPCSDQDTGCFYPPLSRDRSASCEEFAWASIEELA